MNDEDSCFACDIELMASTGCAVPDVGTQYTCDIESDNLKIEQVLKEFNVEDLLISPGSREDKYFMRIKHIPTDKEICFDTDKYYKKGKVNAFELLLKMVREEK